MKKKVFLLVMILSITMDVFAQQGVPDMRPNINSVFTNMIIPIFIFGIIGGIIRGLWMNWDAILGKNGANKQEGWLAVGEQVLYAIAVVAIISAIVAFVSTIQFNI